MHKHILVFTLVMMASHATAVFAQDSGSVPECPMGAANLLAEPTCSKKPLTACQELAKPIATNSCVSMNDLKQGGSAFGTSVSDTGKAMTATGASYTNVASQCQQKKKDCKTECTGADIKKCEDKMDEQIREFTSTATSWNQIGGQYSSVGTASTDGSTKDQTTNGSTTTAGEKTPPAAQTKGAGGGSGMSMGSLAGMGMMGAMMGMMMSQDDDKDKDQTPTLANNSALQANGTVLCDKADSGLYAACDSYLAQACLQAIQGNTYASSATCTTFGSRYCTGGDGITTDTQTTATLSTGTTMPMLGVQGGGSKTPFCQSAVAYNYCSDGMHGACPACQNLANVSSLSCSQNPQACIAQSSGGATLTGLPAICGDDPLVLAARASSGSTVAPIGATAPAVGGIAAPATATLGVQTVLPQSASGLTVYRDTASVKPSSVGTPGPASDVGAEYGPSLGSITASSIQTLCQSGKLNCQ